MVEAGRGVVALFFNTGITTAEGIGIGSSLADLLAAYPQIDYTPVEDPTVAVPSRPDAYFSFGVGPADVIIAFSVDATMQECFG